MAVDAAGAAHITGNTSSDERTFPVVVGPDLTFNGDIDAFVAKLAPGGTALEYAGYLGGSGFDQGLGVALSAAGSLIVVGHTHSTEATFPVAGGPDSSFNGSGEHGDAFVTSVKPLPASAVVLESLDFSGFIGGDGEDGATWLAGYRAATAVDRLRADLALASHAIETPGFGLIVLSDGSRMQFVSPGAASLLSTYFGPRRQASELPASVAAWVGQHTEAARDASRLPVIQTPLSVQRNGARPVVRLVQLALDTMLLLEEPVTREEWLRLAPMGPGAREARVLLEALRQEVVMGGGVMLPDVARRAISLFQDIEAPGDAPRLTPHEERLLRLLIEGHSYKTAAATLGSSVNTVAFHIKHVYEKLQVHSKSEAVARALRDRLVQ